MAITCAIRGGTFFPLLGGNPHGGQEVNPWNYFGPQEGDLILLWGGGPPPFFLNFWFVFPPIIGGGPFPPGGVLWWDSLKGVFPPGGRGDPFLIEKNLFFLEYKRPNV